MPRLDDYRSALLAALPAVPDAELELTLEEGGETFARFVVDHGLGPLWHERTGSDAFHASRMAAEALYLAQEHALKKIDGWLDYAGIDYAVIKGAATRLLTYQNPAVRCGFDIDVLVRPEDRVRAATEFVREGYEARPEEKSISREIVLSLGRIDIDLHWGLLREGRLRTDCVSSMLARRRRQHGICMLDAQDSLFVLLVHPAFAKHLGGWDMGLHRIADILAWIATQSFDWPTVRGRLDENGVRAAAWATLRWAAMLTEPRTPEPMQAMLTDLKPGRLRRAWLSRWLSQDLSARSARAHCLRLLAFSSFLHDTPRDVLRAFGGRRRARRRQDADLEAFRGLLD